MLRAIVFDFDGVVADTEPLHYAAFDRVLDGLGVMPSVAAYYETYVGLSDAAFLRAVFAKAGKSPGEGDLRSLLDRKNDIYFEIVAGGLPLLTGVEAFINRMRRRYPLAICSGARRVEIDTLLRAAGLHDAFPMIVSTEDVQRSKPDPEGFRRAIALLAEQVDALRPVQCLAIEDSANGVAAAKAAEMKVVRVRSHAGPSSVAADLEVADLSELTDAQLAAMFDQVA